jgi:hypothetical protein
MGRLIKVCEKDIKVTGRMLRIARLERERYERLSDPEAVLNGLRRCGQRVDLFTFMQSLPETEPKYSYPMELDNLAVLPISTFDHWLKHQIRFAPRGRLRQAAKAGVTTREVPFGRELVNAIWEIYNESPVRQGKRFPHYGKDIDTVYREGATHLERSIFLGAFLGERMIGFVKLVLDETRTEATTMNIVSLIEHRKKCPTNALIAQAVRSCAERHIPYLVYMKFAYGKRSGDSLSDFKERNGFQRIDLPRYYIPLTPLGRAAFRLGLHHRFSDRVPGPMSAKFREIRAAWYNRKVRPMTEALPE